MSGGGGFSRDALVVAEVAMALVLLAGAGLMLKTLSHMRGIDVGFESDGLLTMHSNLPYPKYGEAQKRQRFYEGVLERVKTLPGVRGAAFVSNLPFTTEGNTNGFRIEGRAASERDLLQDALYRVGTSDYLQTMKAHLLKGRLYGDQDRTGGPLVVVINETLAKWFFPNEDPIGKRMQFDDKDWWTIIGVVADLRERGIDPSPKPAVYLPVAQNGDAWAVPEDVVIRADGDPLALAGPVRAAIQQTDPDLPVTDIRSMGDLLETDYASRKQQMRLLLAFAGLALTLAALGIYGVLSYLVVQQTREIGVRMALGARAADIVRAVASKGLVLTGAGLVIGTGVALTVTRAMQSMLYGVTATDAPTYVSVVLLLAVIGGLACAIPAIRAARVDPMIALRDE